MRLAIVTHYTENIKEYAAAAANVNRQYADAHGIEFLVSTGQLHPDGWHGAWNKLFRLRQLMEAQGHDYLFWIDADAIFLPNIKHKSFFETGSIQGLAERLEREDRHLLICKDLPDDSPINTGTFMIRCSPEMLRYINDCIAYGMYNDCKTVCTWDQAAMQALLPKELTIVASSFEFNFYGSFILHLAGVEAERRVALLPAFERLLETKGGLERGLLEIPQEMWYREMLCKVLQRY